MEKVINNKWFVEEVTSDFMHVSAIEQTLYTGESSFMVKSEDRTEESKC